MSYSAQKVAPIHLLQTNAQTNALMHRHMHSCTDTCTHAQSHALMHRHMHSCTDTCTHAQTHALMHSQHYQGGTINSCPWGVNKSLQKKEIKIYLCKSPACKPRASRFIINDVEQTDLSI